MYRSTVLFAAAVFTAPAFADTHIAYTDASGQPGIQTYVKGGKVRMENGAGQPISIFDTAAPAMLVLNPAKKRYAVFDADTAAHLGAQFQDAQQQLDDATKKLQGQAEDMVDKFTTAAQHGFIRTLVAHAIVDYFVKLMIPHGFALQMELKPLGTNQTVAGIPCDDEQLIINGKPAETRCVAHDLSKLGIQAADLAVLQTMLDDYKQMLGAIEPMAHGISTTMPDGAPIKSQKITWDFATNTQGTRTDTLQSISSAPLPASLFAPPADYTQSSLDELMQDTP